VAPGQSPREDAWGWVHLAPAGSELSGEESAVIKGNPDRARVHCDLNWDGPHFLRVPM
jgi:hypothetical protein